MKIGKTVDLSGFKGINQVMDPAAIGVAMAEGTNVYLSAKRRIRRRAGKSSVVAGAVHSVFATADQQTMVMVKDDVLYAAKKDLSLQSLRTGMFHGLQLSYVEINGRIYYSNGIQTGSVSQGVHNSWGVAGPRPPTLARVNGTMQAGTYGVIATFLRADGQETGSSFPVTLEVVANSALLVGLPTTTEPSVVGVILYMTQPDGAELYQAGTFPIGTMTAYLNSVTLGARCLTMFKSPPPVGQALAYYSGQALIAVGDTLFWTEPYSYELIDYSSNYKQMDDWIDIVAPVEDGVYLSYGDKIAFMRGRDLRTAELDVKTPYGSTPGTLTYVDAIAGVDLPDKKIPVWSTEHGIVAGFSGGQLMNLTADSYRPGKYKGGGAVFMRRDGDSLYIASHRGSAVKPGIVRDPTGIVLENRGPQ